MNEPPPPPPPGPNNTQQTKSIQCGSCNRVFKNSNSLGCHTRKYHDSKPIFNEDDLDILEFTGQCYVCGAVFRSIVNLYRHRIAFHWGDIPVIPVQQSTNKKTV